MNASTAAPPRWGLGALSSFLGIVTEFYDLTLILGLTPILSRVFLPSNVSPVMAVFGVVAGYAVSYMTRPIGSIVFGHYADRVGRKKLMIISMAMMALVTTLVAAFPSYAEAGYLGYILFMIVRGIVGIAYGGDITAGFSFAVEWAPKKWRGMVGGLAIGGSGVGGLLGVIATGFFVAHWGNAAMVAYAWRYVFLSALIPFFGVIVARMAIGETPVFESAKAAGFQEKAPVKTLVQKGARSRLFQSMMMMLGIGVAYGPANAYFAAMLTSAPSILTVSQELFAYGLFYVAEVIAAVLVGGHLSTIIGRRRWLLLWMPILAVTITPVLYGMVSYGSVGNMTMVGLLAFALGILIESPFGVAPSYLNERFGTHHRASGQGISYTVGNNLIAGIILLLVPWIHSFFTNIETPTNYWFTCGLIGIIACLIAIVAVYAGPETAHLDLDKIETATEKTVQ